MKIKKDNEIIEVSKNTYESMFKRLGYEIVSEKKEEPVKVAEEVEVKKTESKKTKKK